MYNELILILLFVSIISVIISLFMYKNMKNFGDIILLIGSIIMALGSVFYLLKWNFSYFVIIIGVVITNIGFGVRFFIGAYYPEIDKIGERSKGLVQLIRRDFLLIILVLIILSGMLTFVIIRGKIFGHFIFVSIYIGTVIVCILAVLFIKRSDKN